MLCYDDAYKNLIIVEFEDYKLLTKTKQQIK